MWVGENEPANYWATVLNSLINRGFEDIHIFFPDNLTWFSQATKGFNRQLRKVTKPKSVFPTDDSLLKMLHRPSSVRISFRIEPNSGYPQRPGNGI